MAESNPPGKSSPNGGESAPKIVIDSDWKAQAQKEKERLAAQEKEAAAKAAKSGPAAGPGMGGPAGPGGQQELPPADFQTLVSMLTTQALMYLGGYADPETGRAVVAPEHARLQIDLLAMIEEKTKGNLTEQEATMLSRVLNELRLQFVEVSKAIERMLAERAAKGGVGGTGAGAGAGAAPPNLKFRPE